MAEFRPCIFLFKYLLLMVLIADILEQKNSLKSKLENKKLTCSFFSTYNNHSYVNCIIGWAKNYNIIKKSADKIKELFHTKNL